MKRIIISVCIIAAIIAAGCSAIVYIGAQNSKLYGELELVEKAYAEGDASGQIAQFESFFEGYAKRLSCIVGEEALLRAAESAARLESLYQSGSDEFLAECGQLRFLTRAIYAGEILAWYRIL